MEASFITRSDAKNKLIQLIRECDSMQWAVAWAREKDNEVLAAAYDQRRKFERLVIGTHFYQTDPAVLRMFEKHPRARMALPEGATFHPKVYLFRIGSEWAAVVGSHNCTRSAFLQNAEASSYLRGSYRELAFAELLTFLDEEWKQAADINKHLWSYEVQHKRNAEARKALVNFNRNVRPPKAAAKAGRASAAPSPYVLTWSTFVQQVSHDSLDSLDKRLAVLRGVGELFRRKGQLARMEPYERKAIAGTFMQGEPEFQGLEWGWFGTMVGAGDFRHLVNDEPKLLDRALKHIPAAGEVSEKQYRAYVADFLDAFERIGKAKAIQERPTHVGGHPTASRLLAMKRPDRFICVNGLNQASLCRAMGVAHTTLDIHNYWDRIAAPLLNCEFWNQPAPASRKQRELWNGRMALLDTIYYVPKK